MRINLGCGEKILSGWVNVDLNPLSNEVIKCDFENDTLPFETNSVYLIQAIDVLEHLKELLPFLSECYRILKPGGLFYIEVPKFPSNAAMADPTHVRYFVDETFKYLTEYEGAKKMYGIDDWKLESFNSVENRIFARLQK